MIDILLSAYNCEKYLPEQLDSLLAQSYADMRIIARDDGSADSTPAILSEYSKKFPDKIILLKDSKGNLGVKKAFFHLLNNSDSQYAMFCDQDDLWLPEKIRITYEAMRTAEEKYGDVPVLVHTDLSVADADLKITAESMFRTQKLNPRNAENIRTLALENVVTGCTAMLNASLKNFLKDVPEEAVIHDWWTALAALKYGGRIVFVDTPTILYRQHGKNSIGAEEFGLSSFARRLTRVRKLFTAADRARKQANALGIDFSTAGYISRKLILIAKRLI
jgi:glycosyltransferase involved in cell wall biosynthesis